MLKNVQSKMWWGFSAALFILLVSWGWIQRNHDDLGILAKTDLVTNGLVPIIVKKPDSNKIHKIEKISEIFERKRRGGFNGNVLVVQKGEVLYEKSFGFAHLRDKDSLDKASRFQLASLSKPFTAVAVLKLIQKGRISLDDSVQKFFPDFPYHGVKVNLLLSHRSGLPNYIYSFPDSVRHGQKYPSNIDIMNWYANVKPTPARYNFPDRSFVYCNTNYSVLAAIAEKVTGKSFEEILSEEIFVPLGMKNTFLITDTTLLASKNRTVGHQYGRAIAKDFYDEVVGDKGLYSTTEDIYRFYAGLEKGLILNKEILAEAFKPRSFEKKGIRNYGYGFRMHTYPDNSVRFIYHGGWWKGYNTMFWICPESESVIIVLGNTYNRATYDIKDLLLVLEEGEEVTDFEKDI